MTGKLFPKIRIGSSSRHRINELLDDPQLMELVKRGMKARIEGKVKPWSQVKEELRIN